MQIVFISATDTNIGKTYTLIRLILALKSKLRVFALKPFESDITPSSFSSSDCFKILNALNLEPNPQNLKLINLFVFQKQSSIYSANDSISNIKDKLDSFILEKIRALENDCDLLFIEGAGGLYSPIDKDYYYIDVAKKYASKILVISNGELGCINHILLNNLALKNTNHAFFINKKENSSFDLISKDILTSALKGKIIDDFNMLLEWMDTSMI